MWTKRRTIQFVVEVGESGTTHAPLRTGPPDSIVDDKITKRFLPNRIGLRPPPKKIHISAIFNNDSCERRRKKW
jgi:hypothetical protein